MWGGLRHPLASFTGLAVLSSSLADYLASLYSCAVCSVLLFAACAVWCGVLWRAALWCGVLWRPAAWCGVLWRAAPGRAAIGSAFHSRHLSVCVVLEGGWHCYGS